MKKTLKILLPIIIISLLAFMGYKVVSKINYKKEVAENIKQMPAFSYATLDNEIFTRENLEKGKPTLFIYFNSDCDFCNEEAKMIKENIDKFNTTQIIFISFEEIEKIKQFATTHQLDTYDNISFLSDTKATFSATFDVKSMPCIVLYDKNNNLIEKIKGQTKAETLIKKLQISD